METLKNLGLILEQNNQFMNKWANILVFLAWFQLIFYLLVFYILYNKS